MSVAPVRSLAEAPALPAPLCALSNLQVVCYDEMTATPRPVTPAEQHVVDFALSPDGNWVVYRVEESVSIADLNGNRPGLRIDATAAAPATLIPSATTIAWSPDGLAIAYITSGGFRVAFPPDGNLPPYAEKRDRPYSNLRFSPGGARLAVQSRDGAWTIFEIDSLAHTIKLGQIISQNADAAWLDDRNIVIAPVSGGLLRIDTGIAPPSPIWNIPDEHFTQLFTTSAGQILATHPDPGDTIGSTVAVSADGRVTPLGNSKIDERVRWGPDGRMMVYIDAGAPILVDRSNGLEDILPVKNVTRLAWSPPLPPIVAATPMDSDLFYLAPDSAGVRQVWRLARSQTPAQITHEPADVEEYAVSADKTQIAMVSAGKLTATTFADPSKGRLLATIPATRDQSTQPTWHPNGKQVAYVNDGINLVAGDGGSAPFSIQPDNHSDSGATDIYTNPQFSVDGRYVAVERSSSGVNCDFVLIDLLTQATKHQAICAQETHWGPGNLLLNRSTVPSKRYSLTVFRLSDENLFRDTQELVPPGWDVDSARFLNEQSVILLRHLGWNPMPGGALATSPDVVQLYSAAIDWSGQIANPKASGKSAVLSTALLSPTGRYAVGLLPGKMDELVILDLQTGRKVRIHDTNRVSSLQWIP